MPQDPQPGTDQVGPPMPPMKPGTAPAAAVDATVADRNGYAGHVAVPLRAAAVPAGGGADGLADRSPDRAAAAAIEERPGSRVGRYKVLARLGEGGFGTVYRAEQEHPVRREVALK